MLSTQRLVISVSACGALGLYFAEHVRYGDAHVSADGVARGLYLASPGFLPSSKCFVHKCDGIDAMVVLTRRSHSSHTSCLS